MPKKQLSPEEEQQRRAAYQRELDEDNRRRNEARRKMFTVLKMWKACPDKRCVRAHACRGDVERCLRERWRPIVPPDLKASIGRMFEYLRNGLSPQEAATRAAEDMARHCEAMARVEAMQAERPPDTPRVPRQTTAAPPPAPPAFSGPRIRSL